MNSVKPIPTEYRGIKFRSKSEAVFARALDIMGSIAWIYEPRDLRLKENGLWIPDFKTVHPFESDFKYCIVEYKPCEPTGTYKLELIERFSRIKHLSGNFSPRLIFGSPYSEGRKAVQTLEGGNWVTVDNTEWLFECMDEASHYRFDLR